eukprot:CAMPEP_0114281572 /NCGR_PEP_ID=MMETSP0059-20121206/3081_1 /TAXON_ID=36894 /ORGANISM="Pyramimonas parkeae, Strain CCMP726" /LENGTH=433 /DNA_ID=CAMNT_0001402125 /DNA_START=72 /DNA_END=1374 /DNA_ORIENTATION=+
MHPSPIRSAEAKEDEDNPDVKLRVLLEQMLLSSLSPDVVMQALHQSTMAGVMQGAQHPLHHPNLHAPTPAPTPAATPTHAEHQAALFRTHPPAAAASSPAPQLLDLLNPQRSSQQSLEQILQDMGARALTERLTPQLSAQLLEALSQQVQQAQPPAVNSPQYPARPLYPHEHLHQHHHQHFHRVDAAARPDLEEEDDDEEYDIEYEEGKEAPGQRRRPKTFKCPYCKRGGCCSEKALQMHIDKMHRDKTLRGSSKTFPDYGHLDSPQSEGADSPGPGGTPNPYRERSSTPSGPESSGVGSRRPKAFKCRYCNLGACCSLEALRQHIQKRHPGKEVPGGMVSHAAAVGGGPSTTLDLHAKPFMQYDDRDPTTEHLTREWRACVRQLNQSADVPCTAPQKAACVAMIKECLENVRRALLHPDGNGSDNSSSNESV